MSNDTNASAIRLNNDAVVMMKAGNFSRAFDTLSEACAIAQPRSLIRAATSSAYRFIWEDFIAHQSHKGDEIRALPHSPSSDMSSTVFLFSRGLHIETNATDGEINNKCSPAFVWALWYNIALSCSLLGTRLGERGYGVLHTAFNLYGRVYSLIEHLPATPQWSILRIAVLNNQACIYHNFAMDDAIFSSLELLAVEMRRSPCVQGADRELFLLNLQILGSNHLAAAA